MKFDYDVIVLGDYCLDLIFTGLPSLPILGSEIEAKSLAMEPGGACNSALALHRLGVKTAWAVEFGTDEFSRFILNRFSEEGFPNDLFVNSKKTMRKITVSLSYPEERAFIAYYDQGNQIQTALKGIAEKSAKILLIPALFYGPTLQIAHIALDSKGSYIFMDGNNSSEITLKDQRIRSTLKSIRMFSLNRKEAKNLTAEDEPEKAIQILGEYCQTVLLKDGPGGSWCCDNGKIYYEPAISVQAIDTTGAGDIFNAGFIKAWLDQKDIQTCLKWGNICGGLSTTQSGANGYILRSNELEKIVIKRSK